MSGVRFTSTRKAVGEMKDSALIRRNMGEYETAEVLHRWAKKVQSAILEDEESYERPEDQKDGHHRVP